MSDSRKWHCSKPGCFNPHRPNQRYCSPCHAQEQRQARAKAAYKLHTLKRFLEASHPLKAAHA